MLNNAEIICFSATTNAQAALDFYQDTLGLRLIEDSPFALVFDANGTMLRLQKVENHTPALHTSLGWQVDDISAYIELLTRKGVRFERYERLQQDALGIWETPSGAKVAWFKDPDENALSLTEFAPRPN